MISSQEPLVSIVTPVYNGEPYLRECIESVLAQIYQNWDYVIVNNCSTDRSLEIALSYHKKDPRIRVHNNTEFVDMLRNHNIALRQISPKSKYCKIVFADDWLFPECLTQMVKLAEENPSVGIVGAYGFWRNRLGWIGLPYSSTVVPGREVCRLSLLQGLYVFGTATSLLIRSDLIRNRDPFYDESNIHADTTACYEILRNSDFGFVHQVLTYSRMRDESATSFSQSINTYYAGILGDLLKYGPLYLSAEETKNRIKEYTRFYYEYLGENVLRFRGEEFWRYHKTQLKQLGCPLNRLKLMRATLLAILLKGIDVLFNPERIIEKVSNRLLSKPSQA